MICSMKVIDGSGERVSRITCVMAEFAFQNSSLALSSAVEAASVGEAGMCFAVVADAVRDLAHSCAIWSSYA